MQRFKQFLSLSTYDKSYDLYLSAFELFSGLFGGLLVKQKFIHKSRTNRIKLFLRAILRLRGSVVNGGPKNQQSAPELFAWGSGASFAPPRCRFDQRCTAFAQRALYLYRENDITYNDQYSVGNFSRWSEVHDDERKEKHCEFYVIRFILLLAYNQNKSRNTVKIKIVLRNFQSSFCNRSCCFLAKSRRIYEGIVQKIPSRGGESWDNSTVLVLGVLTPLNFLSNTNTSKLAPQNPRTRRSTRPAVGFLLVSVRFGRCAASKRPRRRWWPPLRARQTAGRLSRGAWPKACASAGGPRPRLAACKRDACQRRLRTLSTADC